MHSVVGYTNEWYILEVPKLILSGKSYGNDRIEIEPGHQNLWCRVPKYKNALLQIATPARLTVCFRENKAANARKDIGIERIPLAFKDDFAVLFFKKIICHVVDSRAMRLTPLISIEEILLLLPKITIRLVGPFLRKVSA